MESFKYQAIVTAPVTLEMAVPFTISFPHRTITDFDVSRDVEIGLYRFITAASCERFVRQCNNVLRGSARRIA